MKKIFNKLTIINLLILITFVSCSSDSSVTKNYGKLNLKFENKNTISSRSSDTIFIKSFKDVEVYIKSLNPFKLESEEIEELLAKDSLSNIATYGYILKETNAQRWGSKRGYFFDNNSGCLVYGTMYYGDNGVNLFVAASISTQLTLSPICPESGSWAKTKRKK